MLNNQFNCELIKISLISQLQELRNLIEINITIDIETNPHVVQIEGRLQQTRLLRRM